MTTAVAELVTQNFVSTDHESRSFVYEMMVELLLIEKWSWMPVSRIKLLKNSMTLRIWPVTFNLYILLRTCPKDHPFCVPVLLEISCEQGYDLWAIHEVR